MRPTSLKPGDKVRFDGINRVLVFVKRVPGRGPTPAKNIFRCDAWRGLEGPNDPGLCEASDHDVIRRATPATAARKPEEESHA
jgi:hypothetical protein